DRLHAVVTRLGNGIELVIVAAGTTRRQGQEGTGRGADHVVQLVGPLHQRQGRVRALDLVAGPADKKAGSRVGAELVAGELLQDEAVIRFVLVEGANDPV